MAQVHDFPTAKVPDRQPSHRPVLVYGLLDKEHLLGEPGFPYYPLLIEVEGQSGFFAFAFTEKAPEGFGDWCTEMGIDPDLVLLREMSPQGLTALGHYARRVAAQRNVYFTGHLYVLDLSANRANVVELGR